MCAAAEYSSIRAALYAWPPRIPVVISHPMRVSLRQRPRLRYLIAQRVGLQGYPVERRAEEVRGIAPPIIDRRLLNRVQKGVEGRERGA